MNYLFFISLLSAYFPKCLTTPLKILFLVNVFNFPNLTAHFSKCQTILCMSSWFDVVWRQLNYVSSHILCTSVTTSLLYSINKHRFFFKRYLLSHIEKSYYCCVSVIMCIPQLLDGLDVLQRNTLTSLKQEFIANSIVGTYRNLTAQDFTRLGMTVWRHL